VNRMTLCDCAAFRAVESLPEAVVLALESGPGISKNGCDKAHNCTFAVKL